EIPEGYQAPAVDLLLRRPFTRQLIDKVHRTDKGRHNTVLWWAQHLRENDVPKDDALASAKASASLLPARAGEPVPAKEVEDAITWAYAKQAGRNAPIRQTGLEAVAVAGGQGNAEGGEGEPGGRDELDEITRGSARAPITIQSGGYAKVKDTK